MLDALGMSDHLIYSALRSCQLPRKCPGNPSDDLEDYRRVALMRRDCTELFYTGRRRGHEFTARAAGRLY